MPATLSTPMTYRPSMAAPELHPSLSPIAFLLGEWEGSGRGEYPTIEPFSYTEHLTFGHVGKPFLAYLQRTWAPDGSPMHTETGYLRVVGPAPEGSSGHAVEMLIAQPTGVTEVLTGTVDDNAVVLESTAVTLAPTAKRVDATTRTLRLDDGVLVVDMGMAAVGLPMTHHLRSDLSPA
jgi:hypothetical protein